MVAAYEPARELPRVITTGSYGVSRAAARHACARGRWRTLARGVLLTDSGEPTRDDWALVGMAITSADSALSGWDALRTVGLGAALPPRRTVLVLDRHGEHRTVGQVRIRPTQRPYRVRLLPAEHPTLPFTPVVHTARAVADTALDYRTLQPVRALVTSAVQKRLCTAEELLDELECGPRRGSALLRRAVAEVFDGARSVAEAEAIELLRRAEVPAFEANVPLVDSTGRLVAIADLLWRELRAIAEIDSRAYHSNEPDWERTLRRHNRLTRHGLAITHFPPAQIRGNPRAWVAEVEAWLRERARELEVPYAPGGGPIRSPSGPPPFVLL